MAEKLNNYFPGWGWVGGNNQFKANSVQQVTRTAN